MSILEEDKSLNQNLTSAGRKKVEWTKKKIMMVILFSIIFLISVGILIWTFIDKTFLFELIKDLFILPLLDIGWWAYLVFLILMVLQSLIAPIPSELVLLSSGMIFGLWPGMIIGVIGSVISGVVTYFLAVKGGRPLIESAGEYISLADKFILVVDIWIEKWGLWAIIVGRAVPVVMFDPVSYAAGFSNIKWKSYTLATFIGSIPRAIFFAIIGSSYIEGHPDKAEFLRNLSPLELDQVAGQFNIIFYTIFGVLILMLIIASILSNRIIKKREVQKIDQTKENKALIEESESLDESGNLDGLD